jgi:type IV pilus assembly protein PilM
MTRTGIDLGSSSVKLVRGEGTPQLTRFSHVGLESWEADGSEADIGRASVALKRLLRRLKLNKRRLGRVAVALTGPEVSFREVLMPQFTPEELQSALPFEAKKHLNIEGMESPILDAQILGPAPAADEEAQGQMRVLLAATPKAHRDFPLQVLAQAGLEPDVIDIESLAALNELLAHPAASQASDQAVALLDIGGRHTRLHITSRSGGLLSRRIGSGLSPQANEAEVIALLSSLGERILETFTFYRGRYRREVQDICLAGGGALVPDIADALGRIVGRAVEVLDPLAGLSKSVRGYESAAAMGPRFVTACGLCRWWDTRDV